MQCRAFFKKILRMRRFKITLQLRLFRVEANEAKILWTQRSQTLSLHRQEKIKSRNKRKRCTFDKLILLDMINDIRYDWRKQYSADELWATIRRGKVFGPINKSRRYRIVIKIIIIIIRDTQTPIRYYYAQSIEVYNIIETIETTWFNNLRCDDNKDP